MGYHRTIRAERHRHGRDLLRYDVRRAGVAEATVAVGRLVHLRILPAMDRGVFLAHIRRTRFAAGDREYAQADARRIADFLRKQGASRVVGIGSAFAPNRRFTKRSDIDLVVEGLPPRRFFRALAEAADMTAFELDLTPAESATDYMRQAVDDEGVDL